MDTNHIGRQIEGLIVTFVGNNIPVKSEADTKRSLDEAERGG